MPPYPHFPPAGISVGERCSTVHVVQAIVRIDLAAVPAIAFVALQFLQARSYEKLISRLGCGVGVCRIA